MDRLRNIGQVLVVAVACLLAGAPAMAQDAKAFFNGKPMRFITFGAPGGGYDAYMRMMIPYLEKRLGSKIVPINEPGASGMLAMNRIVTAPPDGLTILLTTGEGIVYGKLFELPGARYELDRIVWLARVSGEPKMIALGTRSPYRSLADLLKADRAVVWGATGKIDGLADYAAVLAHALKLNARIVTGYKGSQNVVLAITQGEVDGVILTDASTERITRGGDILAAVALDRERSQLFPNVPTVFELLKPAGETAWWLDWRAKVAALGRVIVTTPQTPGDRVAFLRDVIKDVLHDPVFIAEAAKRRQHVGYASGEVLNGLIRDTTGSLDDRRMAEIKHVILDKFYAK